MGAAGWCRCPSADGCAGVLDTPIQFVHREVSELMLIASHGHDGEGASPVADGDAALGDERPLEPSPYPVGSVRALLNTDHVSPPTRRVLQERLAKLSMSGPTWLSPPALVTLRAICERLVPQGDLAARVDIAGAIDQRLARGEGDGWRPAALPPDRDAWMAGLDGIDRLCQARFLRPFVELTDSERDGLLSDVQAGRVVDTDWRGIDPQLFFEELLAEAVEVFYANPIAQEDIGYAGMADLPDWTHLGLDDLSAREPRRRETSID